MQVFAGSYIFSLRREIGDVDDQRIALPSSPRISPPLPNGRWQMRRRRDRNHAAPSLTLTGVVVDVHHARRLHDPAVHTGEAAGKFRQNAAHAPLAQAAVLRAVGAVERPDAGGWIFGRGLRSPR